MLDAGRLLYGLTFEKLVGLPQRYGGMRMTEEVGWQSPQEPFTSLESFGGNDDGPYKVMRRAVK